MRAINKVQAVLDRDPRNVDLLNPARRVVLNRQDLSRASELFTARRRGRPEALAGAANLARVKLAQHDEAGAANEFHAALELAPTDATLVADAARVYEKQGNIDAAIAAYESLYRQNPQAKQFAANNLAMLLSLQIG